MAELFPTPEQARFKWEQKATVYLSYYPNISELRKNAIINRKIVIGLTDSDVLFICGDPTTINKTVGPWGVDEQWVYSSINEYAGTCHDHYYYFDNGILTSYQK